MHAGAAAPYPLTQRVLLRVTAGAMLRYAGAVLLKSTVSACNCAPTLLRRCLASPAAAVEAASDAERAIAAKIASGLQCASIRVADTSGGCGAMYTIEVRAYPLGTHGWSIAAPICRCWQAATLQRV